MLTLSRRVNESLFITISKEIDPSTPISEFFKSGPIEIYLSETQGNQAKIGIQADNAFNIIRSELMDIQGNK